MRLLDKLQINLSKAVERKLEVDEGRKLAERVDALRELSATEAANLERFRGESLAQAKADIGVLVAEKGSLLGEVERLRSDRDFLLKPVDLREMELDGRKEALDERERGLLAEKSLVIKLEDKAKEAFSRASVALKAAENREDDAKTDQQAAAASRKSAGGLMRESQKWLDKAKEEARQVLEDVDRRDAAMAVRERELLMRQEGLAREQQALSLRERAIIDREETLEREIIRLSKKHD